MKNKSLIISLGEKYRENYVMRSLIQLFSIFGVGVGSAVDIAFVGIIKQMKEKRVEAFFDELAKGELKLTEEVIKSEDFIHRFIITLKAVGGQRRKEKIQYLARLLKNYPLEIGNEELNDEYEIFLNILDNLEYRELHVIVILYDYEKKYPRIEGENESQRVNKFWADFKKEVCDKMKLSPSEFDGYISRIAGTGVYKDIAGTYWDYQGGQGYLSDLFYKLVKYIEPSSRDFD